MLFRSVLAAAGLCRDDNGVASREECDQRLDDRQDDSLRARAHGGAFRIRGLDRRQPGSALAASDSAVGPGGELDHGRAIPKVIMAGSWPGLWMPVVVC